MAYWLKHIYNVLRTCFSTHNRHSQGNQLWFLPGPLLLSCIRRWLHTRPSLEERKEVKISHSFIFHYIDHGFSLINSKFCEYAEHNYPIEIKDTTDTVLVCLISSSKYFHSSKYFQRGLVGNNTNLDKWHYFSFPIANL